MKTVFSILVTATIAGLAILAFIPLATRSSALRADHWRVLKSAPRPIACMDVIDPAPQSINVLRADADHDETISMDTLEAMPSFSLEPVTIEVANRVDEVVDHVAAAPEKLASDLNEAEPELTTPQLRGPTLTDTYGSLPDDDTEAVRKERALKLRQTAAFWEARHRAARLEYSRWNGSNTLRPNWHPAPMTSNR